MRTSILARWLPDPGWRVAGSRPLDASKVQAPGIVALPGGGVRLFYTGVGPGRPFVTCQGYILSAVSPDGLRFEVEPGIRVAPDPGGYVRLERHDGVCIARRRIRSIRCCDVDRSVAADCRPGRAHEVRAVCLPTGNRLLGAAQIRGRPVRLEQSGHLHLDPRHHHSRPGTAEPGAAGKPDLHRSATAPADA